MGRGRDPVGRGWTIILAGNVLRLGLGLVTSIVVARSLGPSDFGVYALLTGLLAIAGPFVDVGLTNGAIRRLSTLERDRSLPRVAASFLWSRVLAAAGLGVVLVAGAAPLVGRALGPAAGLMGLVLLGLVAGALNGAIGTILHARRRFVAASLLTVFTAALAALLAVGLAAGDVLDVATAITGLAVVPALLAAAAGRVFLPADWSWRPPPWSVLRRDVAPAVPFGVWLWLGNLLTTAAGQVDLFLVKAWQETAVVGTYGLAVGAAARAAVLHHSLYTVLAPTAAARGPGAPLASYLPTAFRRVVPVGGLVAVSIPLVPTLVGWLYGDAYLAAARPLQIILLSVIIDLVVTPIVVLVYPLDAPRRLTLANGLQLVTVLVVGVLLIPAMGATGAAWARVAASAVRGLSLLTMARAVRR